MDDLTLSTVPTHSCKYSLSSTSSIVSGASDDDLAIPENIWSTIASRSSSLEEQ